MNRAIVWLTARQLISQRRTLLLAALAMVPVLMGAIFQWGNFEDSPPEWTANTLLGALVVRSLLPLAALIFGTAALGAEIDDGTAVYLLAKPLPRWRILVSKLFVAWVATAAFVVVSAVVSSLLALAGSGHASIVLGFAIAIALGSLVYCCVFVALSVATSRAFVAGLVYVFIWEGVVTGIFSGTRVFSLSEYTLGVAGWIADTSKKTFDPDLAGLQSLILLVVVGAFAVWLGVRLLKRFEVSETA